MSTTTIQLHHPLPTQTLPTPSSEEINLSISQSHAPDNESPPSTSISSIPNGGLPAWSSLLASALFTFWFNGINNSWGVMQASLFQSGLTSTSTLSFVGSLSITLCVILSLLSVRFIRLVGARYAGLIGTLLLGLGELCSGFTTESVAGLFGTAGVLYGVGTSLCFMVATILPSQFFSSKLGLANGLVKFAGGIGGAILSICLDISIRHVGTAWTFRIIGITILVTGVPVSFLITELNPVRSRNSTSVFDFSLFRNWTFTLIFLAGSTGVFALFVPPYFLPLFAQSLGLSSTIGAYIVAFFNLCAALGRLGSGVLCDRIGAVNTFLLASTFNAVSMFAIWPLSSSLPPLVCFAVVNGVANGAFFTTLPTVLGGIYGAERAGVAVGMATTGWSLGYFLGTPLAGYLLQAAGGGEDGGGKGGGRGMGGKGIEEYRPAVFYAGGVAVLSAIFVLGARVRLDRKVVAKI